MSPNAIPSVLLVGIGGYGNVYVEELLKGVAEGRAAIAGAVDPHPEGCKQLAELKTLGVPVFAGLDEALARTNADLAVVSSPLQFHCEQTCRLLEAGMPVLCEKPVATTVEQAERMLAASRRAGKFVAIGYQWSFADPVLDLKRDILAGRFGRPRRLRTLVLWPRPESYFTRNAWAGRIAMPDGSWVLDSPVNNAMAHYLHSMLFMLGGSLDSAVRPTHVDAQVSRANAIENYDTASLRIETEGGAGLFMHVSHAVGGLRGPLLEYAFERGTVRLDADAGHRLLAEFSDGTRRDYGEIKEYPDRGYFQKLWKSLAAARGGEPVTCGIETAMPHLRIVDAIQRKHDEIPTVAAEEIDRCETKAGTVRVVRGLQEKLIAAYEGWTMPPGDVWSRSIA